RMSGGDDRFSVDFEVGRPLLRRLGLYKPLVGAVFGVATYFVLAAGLLPTKTATDNQLAFYGVIAFLAGFSERFTGVIFGNAERPEHDPLELGDMAAACETIRAAIAADKKICVHGDYDADGICATALAVLILRELGADVGWHLPSRFDEGYGVGRETLTRLAGEGVGLVLTVDCGVTAVEEVAHARELGLE